MYLRDYFLNSGFFPFSQFFFRCRQISRLFGFPASQTLQKWLVHTKSCCSCISFAISSHLVVFLFHKFILLIVLWREFFADFKNMILSKHIIKFNLLDLDRPFASDLKNVRKVWDLLYITCQNWSKQNYPLYSIYCPECSKSHFRVLKFLNFQGVLAPRLL